MSYSTELQASAGVAYLNFVGQPVSLEPAADSGLGDELHSRQQRSRPAAVQVVLARSIARQQDSADAVKDFERLMAFQQASMPVGPQVVPEQDSASAVEAFAHDAKLRHGRNAALLRQANVVLDRAAVVGQQSHLLEASLREFAIHGFADTRDSRMFAGDTLAQLRKVPVPALQESLNQPNASADFFEQLLAMIGLIREDYLAVYEALLDKYSDFYKEFNTDIMSKMGDWVNGIEDGKKVQIDPGISKAIKALVQKYSAIPAGMLFPVVDKEKQTWTPATEDQAEKWARAMGLDPKTAVVSDGRGGFCVKMDLSSLIAMDNALQFSRNPMYGNPVFDPEFKEPEYLPMKWDTAKFQAWNTGFTNQEGDLKNRLQLITTKYGNANSYHENFNKILSSQLSQYAEMLKAIASGIA